MIRPDTWAVDSWRGAKLREAVEHDLSSLSKQDDPFLRGYLEEGVLHGIVRGMEDEALTDLIIDLAIGWALLNRGEH